MPMPGLRYFFRSLCIVAVISLVSLSLGSCHLSQNQLTYDRSGEKDIQDYRDGLSPQLPTPEEASSVPDFQPIVSTPADLKLPSPLVTVSVNQTVSLRDLMFELAEQADVDLELDPQIHGSIIFTAKDRPFNEVVDRICEMSGLRYKFQNNVLRVELDRPYVRNYKVDYMNVGRKSASGINSNLSVSGDASAVSSGTSSSSSVSNSFDSNLWKEIDEGLKQILTASDTYLSLATLSDPVAASAPPPPPPPADPNNPNAAPLTPPPLATVPPSLNITQAPAMPALPNPPATYTISKETGVVSVFATERQHRTVEKFFNYFRRISTVQVLIEAKVLEVSLTDEFAAGIDWTSINLTGLSSVSATLLSPGLTPASTNVFNANFDFGHGIKPVIKALSRFGTVRALSSPRVTVMNSQPAVVNVTNNRIYFEITSTTTPCAPSPCTPTVTKTGTTKSAPEGVLMTVLPSANPDTGEILLAIRPTVSKIASQVEDPLNVGNMVPEMSVQEIDSILKIQSGQTMMMGGLMKDQNTAGQEGIPVLGDIPMVGAMFRNHGDNIKKSELVIMLKATIVPGSTVDDADRKLFKDFSLDRRPSRM